MKTTAINQLPYYEDADALAYGTQQASTIPAIDARLPARFASLSAATSAYSAYTAAGNAMTDGMQRVVAGDPQTYVGGQWRGQVTRSASQTTFFNTTVYDGTETGVATLSIPDPGWPYILDTSAVVLVAAQASTWVNVQVRLDSISGAVISQTSNRSGALPAGEAIPIPLGTFPSATLTGAHTVIVTATRTLGSGNWNVPASGSIVNCMIRPSYV
jgi:hypothetical protein